jgi:hypothetical protein
MDGVRWLALLDMEIVVIDGMSGSPVFQVIAQEDGIESHEVFAGVLIRGYLPARRAYFVEHVRIIGLLERFAARIAAS